MFGDFFQRAGNFFTGSGWVSDEEERRKKKRQQQKPQVKQQVQPQGVPYKIAGQQQPQPNKVNPAPLLLKPTTPSLDTQVTTKPAPVPSAAPKAPPAPQAKAQVVQPPSAAPLLIKRAPAPAPQKTPLPKIITKEQFQVLNPDQQSDYVSKLKNAADRNKLDMGDKESAAVRIAAENALKDTSGQKFSWGQLGKDLVGGVADAVTKPARSVINTAQEVERRNKLEELARQGKISVDDYNRNLRDIYKDSISKQIVEGKGQLKTRDTNPLEFAQKFGGEGLDFALNTVAGAPAKGAGLTLQGIKEALKVGGIYGVGQNVADVANKKDVDAGTVVTNLITGGVIGGLGHLLPGAFRAKPKAKEGNLASVAQAGDGRQAADIQTAIEKANDAGDAAEVSRLIETLPEDLKAPMKSALGLEQPKYHFDPKTGKVTRVDDVPVEKIAPAEAKAHQDNFDLVMRDTAEAADNPRIIREGEEPVVAPERPGTQEQPKQPDKTITLKAANDLAIATRQEIERVNADPNLNEVQKLSQINDITTKYNQVKQEIESKQLETGKVVEQAGQELKAKGDAAQQAAATTQAEQAARAEPAAGVANDTPKGTGEVNANNAYSDVTSAYVDRGEAIDSNQLADDLLRARGIDVNAADPKVRAQNRIIQKMIQTITRGKSDVSTLGEIYKSGVVDPIRAGAANLLRRGINSENKITAAVSQLPRTVFARAGFSEGQKGALRAVGGGKSAVSEAAKVIARDIRGKMEAIGNPELLDERLTRFFESPDYLERKYGFGNDMKIGLDELTPDERVIVDDFIQLNKLRNRINFETGLINNEQYAQFSDGMHSPRLYDLGESAAKKQGVPSKFDATAGIQRKELSEISDETFSKITPVVQGMLLRLESALRNKAQLDSISNLAKQGLVFDRAPNKGFTQLKGKQYGEFDGKWVDNQVATELMGKSQFNTEAGQATDKLLDVYRNSFLGKLDRGQKQIKTVFSPGTFLGNVLSNPLAFNRGAGVNALSQSAHMVKAAGDLIQHRAMGKFDPRIYELEKSGIFGQNTGRALTGEKTPELQLLADGKWKKNPIEATKAIYGGVDDAAKLALYDTLLKKGLSKDKALQRVGQFTQDYNNAGRLIQTLADAPVMGKPFARFIPELLRIMKNNVIYNPLGITAGLAGLAIVQNELSRSSGETPEQREARETATGQTLLPGTGWLNKIITGVDRDISLNFPIPKLEVDGKTVIDPTAVNVARSLGLNFPQEPGGDANTALIKQLAPFVIPTTKNPQGDTVFSPSEVISSLALSPIADQLANRDFMGRKITDPENKVIYDAGGMVVNKFSDSLHPGEEAVNRARTAAMSYLPFANETDALFSALDKKEDYYGKERTVPQAIARMFGLKAESNSPEAQQKRVENQEYFDEKLPAVQGFLRDNPDLAPAYFKINNPTKDRETNVKESDLITPEKWDAINSDTTGRLYNFMKDQAVKRAVEEGKPLDPVYRLDPEQARYVTELRSRPTGDDIEAQEILRATQPWFNAFEDAQSKYYEDNDTFYKANPINGGATDSPRVIAYREANKPVQQPPIVAEYYRIKAADPVAAKAFSRANSATLSPAFDDYAAARLNRINTLRAIEGYAPIEPEVFTNKTFGFDARGAGGGGSGYGYGGGGSRGGGSGGYSDDTQNLLNKLSDVSVATPLAPIDPQAMPALMALLKKAMAGGGSGRAKPRLGAASSGRG